MELQEVIILCALFFVVATLYTTVGHAGASGYLAMMGLIGLAPAVMRPTALLLNILVAAFTVYRFRQARYFSWRGLWPFLLGSVPFAALGGMQNLAAAADAMPDFNLEAPLPGSGTDIALEASAPGADNSIDFNFELPAIDAPAPAPAAPAADAGLDFKIDIPDLNINLDEPSTASAPAENKDGHWYDVQQKFDLAKAYQEMGDNDGAREILQEVIKEGDSGQKDQAQKLLGSLG